MSGAPRPAVFFDRDGVINADSGYVGEPARFALLPGAAEGLRFAAEAGALCFLVTNQSGVARGFYAEADVEALHRHMAELLAREGARFDDIRHCPHLPDAPVAAYRLRCACRKPEPGMILDAAARLGVDPAACVVVGDIAADVTAAHEAGATAILVGDDPAVELAERGVEPLRLPDLGTAVDLVLSWREQMS